VTTRTVYLVHDGATLRREGERLRVFVRRDLVKEFPARGLRQLVLMGNITLTPSALDLLVRRGVDVVLLSHRGRYRGRIVSGPSSNVALRMAQYRELSDPGRTLELARRFVHAKISNQRVLLLRHARRHPPTRGLLVARVAMKASLLRLDRASTLDELRGAEGAAAASYFRSFDDLLRAPGFRFDGRNRRPPKDPVNALLSLGYTLLLNVVEAAVQVVGLDPYLGALHAPLSGRPSLVCDLVEELRAPVVDGLVLAAINKQALTPKDFEEQPDGAPVVLPQETLRWFVTLFERRVARGAHYAPFGKRLSYRDIAEQQARKLARDLLGEGEYAGFGLR